MQTKFKDILKDHTAKSGWIHLGDARLIQHKVNKSNSALNRFMNKNCMLILIKTKKSSTKINTVHGENPKETIDRRTTHHHNKGYTQQARSQHYTNWHFL